MVYFVTKSHETLISPPQKKPPLALISHPRRTECIWQVALIQNICDIITRGINCILYQSLFINRMHLTIIYSQSW